MGKLRGGGKKSTKSRKLPPPKTITVLYGSLLALTSTDQLSTKTLKQWNLYEKNAGAEQAWRGEGLLYTLFTKILL